jgi:hypothetical protein
VGRASPHHRLGIVERQGGAVVGQVAERRVAATREDDLAQVGCLSDDVEEARLPGALVSPIQGSPENGGARATCIAASKRRFEASPCGMC